MPLQFTLAVFMKECAEAVLIALSIFFHPTSFTFGVFFISTKFIYAVFVIEMNGIDLVQIKNAASKRCRMKKDRKCY
jgi:hypothetical protein